jgi:hypothetical protein
MFAISAAIEGFRRIGNGLMLEIRRKVFRSRDVVSRRTPVNFPDSPTIERALARPKKIGHSFGVSNKRLKQRPVGVQLDTAPEGRARRSAHAAIELCGQYEKLF